MIRIQDITIIQYFDKLIYKLWQPSYRDVLSLGLENRLVPVKNVSHIKKHKFIKTALNVSVYRNMKDGSFWKIN